MQYPPKQTDRNKRRCCICNGEFFAFKSSNRRACGAETCRKAARGNCGRRHGESGTRLHNIWNGMNTRCRRNHHYMHLSVCDEWASYERFRDWAYANGYAEDLEIDRKENDKGYSPDNCRWATRKQQMQNTGARKQKNKTSQYKGVQFVGHTKKHWRALACIDGKPKQLGLFEHEQEAAAAYDAWAKVTYGKFANVNFKQGDQQS